MNNLTEKEIRQRLEKRDFSCTRCSRCCRKEPGIVMLTEEDFERARKNLELSVEEFLEKCCREVYRDDETFVGLKEKKNYDCIFWDNGCIIYEDRPLQCRTFPYWPYLVEDDDAWHYEKKRCPGLDQKGSLSIEERYALYEQEKAAVYKKMK